MQIFQLIATIIGCISAALSLTVAIIKPFRQWVIESFARKSQYAAMNANMEQINDKMNQTLQTITRLDTRLTSVEDNVLENEADRLRAELFDCGNRCRRKIRLHPEEMCHIHAVFAKYATKLHQNGEGEAEYKFICSYYNKQNFPEYHKTN